MEYTLFVWRLHTGVWARNVTPPRLARYSSIQSLLRLSAGLAAAKTCTYVCMRMHMCVCVRAGVCECERAACESVSIVHISSGLR